MLKIRNKNELLESIREYAQIVCFGMGENFNKLYDLYGDTILWDKLGYVVDNDEKKQGKDIVIKTKKFSVISLQDLKKISLENYAFLITPAIYMDIIKQISEDPVLKDIDCFCLIHILALIEEEDVLSKKIPCDIKLSDKSLIPKVIHYCWFGENPIPDKYKIWMESWHKYCPDYEIIQWNETNYDITQNTYMYQAYKEKKWAFVPDYARLDIIYHYGGIYLDTDVELLQNLDELLYQKGFAGFETNDYVALGLGFGAVKGLPIIKKMRDVYKGMDFIYQKENFSMIASPYWQTKVLKEYGLCTNGTYQIVEDMTIYPVKMFNGRSILNRNTLKVYPKSLHHYEASSWQEERIKESLVVFDRDMKQYYLR